MGTRGWAGVPVGRAYPRIIQKLVGLNNYPPLNPGYALTGINVQFLFHDSKQVILLD